MTEHLRLSGLYWGLTSLYLLGQPDALPRSEILDFVVSCLQANGGFGAAPGHDAHMLYTVSGVQILALLDAFDEFEQRVPGGLQRITDCIFGPPSLVFTFPHRFCFSPFFRPSIIPALAKPLYRPLTA